MRLINIYKTREKYNVARATVFEPWSKRKKEYRSLLF